MKFGWLTAVEIVGIALLILVLILVCLAIRRRWLARNGGTFECSMRHRPRSGRVVRPTDEPHIDETPSARWVLGVARYSGEYLQWFRFFSLAWWPKYSFDRSRLAVVEYRRPNAAEAVALYADQEVVTLAIGSEGARRHRDLAMTPDSLTGMLSWLEASPPGSGHV